MKTQNPKIGEINTDNLVDASVIRRIDQSGFFEKLYAEYGVKWRSNRVLKKAILCFDGLSTNGNLMNSK